MWSPDDPSNRQPMLWKEMLPYADPQITFNEKLFEHCRRLIAVRQALPALRTGEFFPVSADDGQGIVVYGRRLKDQVVYVVLNRSGEQRQIPVTIPAEWADKRIFNWIDQSHVRLHFGAKSPDFRTTASIKEEAKPLTADNGALTITLPAYGAAVLATK